jgi:hypothetical protein
MLSRLFIVDAVMLTAHGQNVVFPTRHLEGIQVFLKLTNAIFQKVYEGFFPKSVRGLFFPKKCTRASFFQKVYDRLFPSKMHGDTHLV